jgi:hypothetical protein
MATRWTSWLALGVSLLGCSDGAPGSSTTAQATLAPAPAFSGPLTSERVLSARGLVRPLDPWLGALEKLEAKLGKPTRVDNGFYEWSVLEGDTCTLLQIERVDDGRYLPDGSREVVVGLAFEPLKATPRSEPDAYKTCVAVTRGAPPPARASSPPALEESAPQAAAPSIAELQRDAAKWAWKRVKLKGLLKGVSKTSMKSGDTTVELRSATIVASEEPGAAEITCALRAATEAPSLSSRAPVVADGVVSIDDGGGPPSLEDCTLSAP